MEPQLAAIIDSAVQRVFDTLDRDAPALAAMVRPWAIELARTDSAADYYKHILAFPTIELAWWAEASLGHEPDPKLHADLVYADVTGYYFIRMMDNLMDGHDTVETQMLPAMAFFHTEFMTIYQGLFGAGHPFWTDFKRIWYTSGDVTTRERQLADLDMQAFMTISSRKACAAQIPVSAIFALHEQPGGAASWVRFMDTFAVWHLFEEDLLDWHIDLKGGVNTFFLCEANRRKQPGEVIEAWVLREGFDWGLSLLDGWMTECREAVLELNSASVFDYLGIRSEYLAKRTAKLRTSMQAMTLLFKASQHE